MKMACTQPWEIRAMNVENATDTAQLPPEKLQELAMDYWRNMLVTMELLEVNEAAEEPASEEVEAP